MAASNTEPLRIEVRQLDAVPLVALAGEVDIASVPQLEAELSRLLDGGATRLIVDLAELQYIDSTGLGCLAAARRRARDAGGNLVVVCGNERILRLFAITGLDQVFTICAGPAEAQAALGAG